MTLSEWLEQNKNKEITYNDGKIEIKTTRPFYHGETYYYVTSTGTVFADCWVYGYGEDQALYEMGNCFRTKEEAEEAAAVIREAFAKIREENE